MKFIARNSRFIIAGVALIIAFILSVQFSDRGWQFDLDSGGTSVHAGPEPKASYNLAGAKILNKVLLQINEKYVDPTRINPDRMLAHSLDALQNRVPEVVITFDRDVDDNPTTATVQADSATKTFRIGKMASLWDMSFKLKEVFRFLQDNLTEREDLKFATLEYAAINGILNTLDPHSMLLSPEIYKEMQTQTGGKFGGLGIVIGIRENFLTVIAPMEGTPASKAGIKTGDRIMRINDESTINMSLNDAVSKLRGDPGTQVTIGVARKGWSEPKEIEITRAIIKIESVESHMLAGKIGYVKIKNFQANTHTDLKKALDQLNRKSGGINGLVLDLRNNPGGLLDQAIKVSDTFLDHGTVVSTVGFGNKLRDESKATKRGTEPPYPMIVLVDPGSASASEIVSGALKNHDRALIVGNRTFGKGSVQVIYELSDGSALKLTIAQYLTPGDISIQSVGITPDMQLLPVTVDKKGVDMFISKRITREADLDAHLDHSNVKNGDRPLSVVRYLKEREPEPDFTKIDDSDKFKEDFGIKFAQQMLRASQQVHERPKMLKTIEPALMKVADGQMTKISAALGKLGVSWQAGQSGRAPSIKVEFGTAKPDNHVKAGDKLEMVAAVTNTGSQTIYRLRGVSECDNGIFDDREFAFGKLEPGQTKSWSTKVDVPKYHPTRSDIVKLNFGAMGADIDTKASMKVNVEGKKRPHFAFTYYLDETKGNGDGVLQSGESATLHLVVTNTGDGPAGKTTAYLRNLSEAALFLKSGREETEGIEAGKSSTFEFTFDVKKLAESSKLKVEIEIFDEVFKEFTSDTLEILAEAKASQPIEKAKGLFTVTDAQIELHVADRPGSHVVATAKAGSSFKVTAKSGNMIRLTDAGKLRGWAEASQGKVGQGKASGTHFTPAMLRSSPLIKFDDQTVFTNKAVYRLEGVATDNDKIRDYYLFSYTRKEKTRIGSKKVAYAKGGAAMVKIAADVPLAVGMNRVRIYVRDDDDMVSSDEVFIFRTR